MLGWAIIRAGAVIRAGAISRTFTVCFFILTVFQTEKQITVHTKIFATLMNLKCLPNVLKCQMEETTENAMKIRFLKVL